jgi:hypothetical protein
MILDRLALSLAPDRSAWRAKGAEDRFLPAPTSDDSRSVHGRARPGKVMGKRLSRPRTAPLKIGRIWRALDEAVVCARRRVS